MARFTWPGALVVLLVGLVLWFFVAGLLPGPFSLVVMIIGILMAIVGAVGLVAAFVGGGRTL